VVSVCAIERFDMVETYDDGYVEDGVRYLRRLRCPRGIN